MQWRIPGIVLLAAACSGCATVAGNVPSFQYCDRVNYQRSGNLVTLTAECQLPIGSGSPVGAVVPGL